MTRRDAEVLLYDIFGFEKFYDEQWESIERLFKGERVLLIERTGFGKSLCYQFPATQFDGLTIVFSPLIALMRDQVNWLLTKGISASYINSEQSPEANSETIEKAINGEYKILYIAPERQENQEWIDATRKMNLSMIIVDEAHTISVWGHDFRPAFRRIINLVRLLPQHMPLLATTATATKRVQEDVEKQLSENIITIRGKLIRENLKLFVIKVSSEEEKFIWLAENLTTLEGNGIIYTGTRQKTDDYNRWLNHLDIKTTGYNAGLDGETRKSIELGFMNNKWKAVISTNALGMGIDKADLRFVIHTQIPASPIHYYQEIGRAGRDGQPANVILFYNSTLDRHGIEEDYKLPKSFIDGARPSIDKYERVIDAIKGEQLGERQIMKAANLKQTQVRVIKADLIEQGIVKEVIYNKAKKYEYQFGAPELNTIAFDELRILKLAELSMMVDYVNLSSSRMKFLCEYLGDDFTQDFSNCDNTNQKKYKYQTNEKISLELKDFHENYFPKLIVEGKNSNIENGVAASDYSISNVGETIYRCKYEHTGHFPRYLVSLTIKAFKSYFSGVQIDLIVYVPPTESGDLVKNLAEKISERLSIPISHNLITKGSSQPQRSLNNWVLKKENVADKFVFVSPDEIAEKSILLIDDVFNSGSTIKEIGKVLTNGGAKEIFPLVIAKASGGDIQTN